MNEQHSAGSSKKRSDFERWATSVGFSVDRRPATFTNSKDRNGRYDSDVTWIAWQAWEARADAPETLPPASKKMLQDLQYYLQNSLGVRPDYDGASRVTLLLEVEEALKAVAPETPQPASNPVTYDSLPLGARFRYPGKKNVWVKLENGGCGIVAQWDNPALNWPGQGIYSFADSEQKRASGLAEWIDRPSDETPACQHPAARLVHHGFITGRAGDYRCAICDAVVHLPVIPMRGAQETGEDPARATLKRIRDRSRMSSQDFESAASAVTFAYHEALKVVGCEPTAQKAFE